jgi:glutathione S-transferase
LIPAGREDEIKKWSDVSEEGMRAGRALLVPRLLASGPALDETLPPAFPSWLRPLLRPATRYGTRWFSRKYALRLEDVPEHLAKVRSSLETLRAALAKSSPYLLGTFSYADIVMSILLQGVVPVSHPRFPLGPAMRVAWTREDLAAEFADLLAWRDRIYELHRT